MSLKVLLTGKLKPNVQIRRIFVQRTYATTSETAKDESVDITSVDTQPIFKDEISEEELLNLEKQRNKSRLNTAHRNMLFGRRPYEKEYPAYHHYFIKWKRRMLGKYGIEGLNVYPGVAWPTKEELQDKIEWEKVAYPMNLQQCWTQIVAEKAAKAAQIQAREDLIAANLAKTNQWQKDLEARIAKKQADIVAAQARKERIVEEVRRHFGFKVDPRDERFKEMMEKKEKEDKKLRKEAKKKAKSERMMARLLGEAGEMASDQKAEGTENGSAPKDLA